MLDFNMGVVVFQLILLITPLASVGLIIYGSILFSNQSKAIMVSEKQHKEMANRLSLLEEGREK